MTEALDVLDRIARFSAAFTEARKQCPVGKTHGHEKHSHAGDAMVETLGNYAARELLVLRDQETPHE